MSTIHLSIVSLFLIGYLHAQQAFTRSMTLMGSGFEITIVAKNQKEATYYIEMAVEEISRIEQLISSWDPNSQTSQINHNAGKAAVVVDSELFELIQRSLSISKITQGAFDISYASMDRIWKFDGSMTLMPDKEVIRQSVSKVGFEKVILDPKDSSVFLEEEGMKIGFGAIGKGYAADKAKDLLKSRGAVSGIINASGDMSVWGTKADGSPWMVGISNPMDKSKVFSWFPIKDGAVVTSGDYEKYTLIDGKRYAHIINPKTGMPSHELISATVMAPKAELADALATSLSVMGVEAGLAMIDQLDGIECVLVDSHQKIHQSKNIELLQE